jgi:citrate synthase
MNGIVRGWTLFVNLDQYDQYMIWITRAAASKRLNIKPQTLYAYVSRGKIAARALPDDPRVSLYAEQDVVALVQCRTKGRRRVAIAEQAIAWGDPVLETAIATVRDGTLLYRGKDAVAWSSTATLEQTAALLWDAPLQSPLPEKQMKGADATTRALAYLARRAATDAPSISRSQFDLAVEAFGLLSGFGAAITETSEPLPIHQRLANFWGLNRAQANVLRQALVLVADHELNPSTFAARVAASTGASLAAAALAGCATLTGPLHGQASRRAFAYLEAAEAHGSKAALSGLAARGEPAPALGHALYPAGDPRARALLKALRPPKALADAVAAAERAGGEKSNIDMALAALTRTFGLGPDAPFIIFAVGRMVGWLAHAMEQSRNGRPIRPRAAYVGQ